MTSVSFVVNALEKSWQSSFTGREIDVPKPYIVPESEQSNVSVKESDIITIRDGGPIEKRPFNLGYNEERVESVVEIDIRTVDRGRTNDPDSTRSPGATRLYGKRDKNDNTSEKYGGLIGEVERIFHELRFGENEFCKIQVEGINDISEQSGTNHYRALLTVRLIQYTRTVNPTP